MYKSPNWPIWVAGSKIHKHLNKQLTDTITENKQYSDKIKSDLAKLQQDLDEIGDLGQTPDTYYDSIDEAYNHKGSLKDLQRQLEQTETKEDKVAFEKASRLGERFNFGLVGIEIGSILRSNFFAT